MFTIDELIVKSDDNLSQLIEDRARLFLTRFGDYPTTAFVPPGTYRELLKELAYHNRHSYSTPMGHTSLAYNTSIGTIHLKIIKEVKSFLMVGRECTYADFDFIHGVPRELWSDSSRKKIDEDFENIVLGS